MSKKTSKELLITEDFIISKIHFLRDEKVMLDKDLAALYGVQTRVLNQAVKRNIERFPSDFMFQLSEKELKSLRSQIVTLENGRGKYSKYLPYAFTEQGVAMLSSVLKSQTAIDVNIQIIRTFTRMRRMLLAHGELMLKLEKMEKDVSENKEDIKVIFEYLKELINPPQPDRTKIGFRIGEKKGKAKNKK